MFCFLNIFCFVCLYETINFHITRDIDAHHFFIVTVADNSFAARSRTLLFLHL